MLSRLRRERGQDLVEFALVLPLVVLLILGIIQFTLVMIAYNTIADAARSGARYGAVAEIAGNANYKNLIKDDKVFLITDAAGLVRANLTVQPELSKDADPPVIQVDVTYKMNLIVPFYKPSITLRAVSTKVIELQ